MTIAPEFLLSPSDSPERRAETLARLKAEILARAEVIADLLKHEPGITKAVLALAALEAAVNQAANIKATSLDGRAVYHRDVGSAPMVLGAALQVINTRAAESFLAAVAKLAAEGDRS